MKKKLIKPSWIKIRTPSNLSKVQIIKNKINKFNLHTVCIEAACPNILSCFKNKSIAFMILGSICTRNCVFCHVKHGKPSLPDLNEAKKITAIIKKFNLKYIVITSVTRDDLIDGGASYFVNCIKTIRQNNPKTYIEILVPDFIKNINLSVKLITKNPPDIFNHNLETIPRLYKKICPGAKYKKSLKLLNLFKKYNKNIITKSGIILGLGEKYEEIIKTMYDLKKNHVDILTISQYLQPSNKQILIRRYVTPKEFLNLKHIALKIGFINVFSGPLIRSSYKADLQIKIIEEYKFNRIFNDDYPL